MIAIKSIKEAFSLFIKDKTLWSISLVLQLAYILLSKFFNALSLQMLASFPLILYMVLVEVVLIDAVNLLYSGEKINFKNIQASLKKYSLRVLAIPFAYFFSFLMFLCVVVIWGRMSLKEPNGLSFFLTLAVGLLFLYLLPFFFSSRFVVLRDAKIWESIYEAFKLYWGRIFDTIVLAFFMGITNVGIVTINVFLSFGLITLFGHSLNPSLSISFVAEMLNAPIGIFATLFLVTFSTLWNSSTITIYFKKIEELGEFGE